MAAVLRELIAAGLEGEALVAAFERIEASEQQKRTARQERNRRYYENRLNKTLSDVSDASPPPSNGSPTPPPITTPPTSSLRSESIKSTWPTDFRERFWQAYPRKVGKKAAFRKLEQVRKAGEIDFEPLLAAVRAIEADDEKFVPHPLTWLNQGRYLDGNLPLHATGPPKPPAPGMPTDEELRRKYA